MKIQKPPFYVSFIVLALIAYVAVIFMFFDSEKTIKSINETFAKHNLKMEVKSQYNEFYGFERVLSGVVISRTDKAGKSKVILNAGKITASPLIIDLMTFSSSPRFSINISSADIDLDLLNEDFSQIFSKVGNSTVLPFMKDVSSIILNNSSVSIHAGKIDNPLNFTLQFRNLVFSTGLISDSLRISSDFKINNSENSYKIITNLASLTSPSSKLSFSISTLGITLKSDGILNKNENNFPTFEGDLDGEIESVNSDKVSGSDIAGKLSLNNKGVLIFSELAFKGDIAEGSGTYEVNLSYPIISKANLNLKHANLDSIFGKETKADWLSGFVFNKFFKLSLKVKSTLLKLKDKEIKDIELDFIHVGEGFLVNKLIASNLAGNTKISLLGNKADEENRISSDAIIEGDNLKEFLIWTGYGSNIAVNMLGKTDLPFQINSELAMSPTLIETAKTSLKYGEQLLAAKAKVNFGDKFSGVVNVFVNELILDNFFGKVDNTKSDKNRFGFRDSLNSKLLWLRGLKEGMSQFAIKIQSNSMKYKDFSCKNLSATIRLSKANLEIPSFYCISDEYGEINSSLQVDSKQLMPKYNGFININKLDLNKVSSLMSVPNKSEENKTRWSYDKYDFAFLIAASGTLKLQIDELILKNAVVSEIDTDFFTDGTFAGLENFRGKIFGGNILNFNLKHNISPPETELAFETVGVHTEEILNSLFRLTAIKGGTSNLNGKLSFIGSSPLEWARSLKGRVASITSNTSVNGFDLTEIVTKSVQTDKIDILRNIADESLSTGNTPLAQVILEGEFRQGYFIAKSIGIQGVGIENTKYEDFDFNLPQWQIAINTELTLGLSDGKIILKSQYVGPPETAAVVWDKSGVEKYWSDKFYYGKKR